MSLSKLILKLWGWKVDVSVPDAPKAIICVAPHTSNWDFILGKLAYASIGRKAGFLMKSTWFFFPLGLIFKAMGGIPVVRKGKKGSLVEEIVKLYHQRDKLTLAITPEGTRKATSKWRTGFLTISKEAHVPVFLGVIDYKMKTVIIKEQFHPTGNMDADINAVKDYYRQFTGKYPEKFCADYE